MSERREYEQNSTAYQGELYSEVGKEHALCALPLILGRWNLVWLKLPPTKVRDGINNDPGNTTSEIDNLWFWVGESISGEHETRTDLVEEETRKASGDDGVTDQEVPVHPLPLDPTERGKVCASVELLGGMLVENGGRGGSRVEGHDRVGEGDEAETTRLLVLSPRLKNRTTLFFPRLLRLPDPLNPITIATIKAVTRLVIIIIVLAVSKMLRVLNYPGMLPRRPQSVPSSVYTFATVQSRAHLLRCVHTQNRRSSCTNQYIIL
jgi:hypothetical protein